MRKNTQEAILEMFEVDTKTGCWLWTGTKDKDGYPLVKWQGKTHRATRLIWAFNVGPIANELRVLHRCDTPCCVSMEHLFLGTDADNHADCVAKGRQAKGEKSGRYTHPETTARGDRSGPRRHPERMRRGEQHPWFGKKRNLPRNENGQFVPRGHINAGVVTP